MTEPLTWTITMPETGDAELDTLALLNRIMTLRMETIFRTSLDADEGHQARERIAKYFYERWRSQ